MTPLKRVTFANDTESNAAGDGSKQSTTALALPFKIRDSHNSLYTTASAMFTKRSRTILDEDSLIMTVPNTVLDPDSNPNPIQEQSQMRRSRALIMGAVPFIMLIVMMQIATSPNIKTRHTFLVETENKTSQHNLRGNINVNINSNSNDGVDLDLEDISISALSKEQQGLWTMKIETTEQSATLDEEDEPRNRAWKFSLSKIITTPDSTSESNGSMTIFDTTTSTMSEKFKVASAQHHFTIDPQELRNELPKYTDLFMEVEPIRISSAASSALTRSTRRRLDETITIDPKLVWGDAANEDTVEPDEPAQPGTRLYTGSSSRVKTSSTHDFNHNMWNTHFATNVDSIQPRLIPEGFMEIVKIPPVSSTMFGSASAGIASEDIILSNEKPVMFTFYSPIEDSKMHTGMSPEADQRLLNLWKEEWSNAGWDPRIITLETAMQHPSFERLNHKLSSLVKSISTYDRFCFVRWLAMAVATNTTTTNGGGWMSDYDTFPLHALEGRRIPNSGRLTVHEYSKNGGVPSLVSGSSDEWDRLAKELIHNAYLHRDLRFWSDMFALHDIYVMSGKTVYLMDHGVTPAQTVMRKQGIDDRTCTRTQDKYAIHFSHYALENGVDGTNVTMDTSSESKPERRASVAQEWLRQWRMQCIHGQQ